jgi:hypothetical protein
MSPECHESSARDQRVVDRMVVSRRVGDRTQGERRILDVAVVNRRCLEYERIDGNDTR